ncbi:DUF3152 domain-containing protein [Streptomyces sp. NBC_00582]|uniref:DUF3152 domain-containing protein n=1 Tax=Streptomyces sp. NBC_00582 TaxID=2975783 RepID=UPI002E80599D|nr:DUF3152 domain-containing protein [Streptomyces sp. NBC_00582]WUB66352.1 DUF3152 domain-containing protein [Streptomyces sp. NBC_00582]
MSEHKAKSSTAGRRRRGPAHASGRRRGKGLLWTGLAVTTALGVAGFAAVGWALPAGKDLLTRAGGAGSGGSAEPSASESSASGAGADDGSGAVGSGTGGPGASGAGVSDSDGPAPGRTTPRPGASSSGSSGSASPSASPSPSTTTVPLPSTGPGTFVTASGGSDPVGKGKKPLRYRVEVETGLRLSTADVAQQVDTILADPRGWTADGVSAFQRVSGGPADFVVKVATPGTVDRICLEGGLDTHGDFNCSHHDKVMVNLERWELATPVYADDVPSYRALIINHEVGHFLGHNHVGCPGAGRPAPAMMQQIKGMNGCVPNVWPYDDQGNVITGPAVP